MCRIEQFDIVYLDGSREVREQVRHCRRGTRSQPCTHREFVRIGDRLPSPADLRNPPPPHIVPFEPAPRESSQPRPSRRMRTRDSIEGMTVNLKFWNPFSSKNRGEKKQYYFVRKTKKREHRPEIFQPYPPGPPPPPPIPFVPPVRVESPVVIPIEPPGDYNVHPFPEREPERMPAAPIIHQGREDESSSPPEASREHGRRTRSLSPHSRFLSPRSRYEIENELLRNLVNIREEREARERAERLQHEERQRARDERHEARRRHRLAIEREAIHRERARIRQEQEDRDRERLANELNRERARIRQEQEDRDRERLANEREARHREQARMRQEQEDRDRERQRADRQRHHEARAWRQQEEQDNERRRAAERDRLWRLDEDRYLEQQRHARAHQANIPRDPHHPVLVHGDEGRVDRGERFIRNAIREEYLRQFEMRARRSGNLYDDGGVRRRNTVDGGQRWYDEQGRRWRDRRDRR